VSPLALAVGVFVVLGATIALAAGEARLALFGLAVTLVLAPFVADPLPDTLPLAVRVVAATLTAYLLAIAARRSSGEVGSPLGLPATLAAGAAAMAAGFAPLAVGVPRFGPEIALGAGFACIVLAVPAVVLAHDAFRLGTGLLVLVSGALLARVGLIGTPPTAAEQIATALLLVALGGAIATLAGAAASASGSLAIDDPGSRERRPGGRS
jgi:hypothetical protein